MQRFLMPAALVAALLAAWPAMAGCGPEAIGTSHTIEVDPAAYPRIGDMQYRQTLPLEAKEVVLTFDDGPWPPMTTRVLEILKSHCVKATFFLIGRNAKAFPAVVQQIAREGHTVAAHSQTHPYFQQVSFARGVQEIEESFRTIESALAPTGVKPAPFFRFPGLISTNATENYLRSQGIASLGTDLLASDWFRRLQKHPEQIFDRAITRIEARGSGILLLHDVKIPTVEMLPDLLKEMKERGYRIVHMVPPSGAAPKSEPAPAVAEKAAPKTEPAPAATGEAPPKLAAAPAAVEEAAPKIASAPVVAEKAAPKTEPAPAATGEAPPKLAAAPAAIEEAAPKIASVPAVAEKTAPARKQARRKRDGIAAATLAGAEKPAPMRKRGAHKHTPIAEEKPPAEDNSIGSRWRKYLQNQARAAEQGSE